jgi:hypothetical protein
MKTFPLVFQLFVALAVSGCDNSAGDNNVDEFRKTESLKITYRVSGDRRVLTLSDPKKVKEVVRSFQIESRMKGAHAGIDQPATVSFTLKGGAVIELYFVSKTTFDAEEGRIDLKNTDFYDKINRILSEKEGKKIDVLIDN